MFGKPRIGQNNLKTSLRFPCFSLHPIIDSINSCHYCSRCIKPNHNKLPDNFDVKIVADQLRSTGVLETTRIRRLGYSTRLSFHLFLLRYWLNCYYSAQNKGPVYVCKNVLTKLYHIENFKKRRANNVDPDEAAHNELPHLDLCCFYSQPVS